jgi:hypothetical protein
MLGRRLNMTFGLMIVGLALGFALSSETIGAAAQEGLMNSSKPRSVRLIFEYEGN